MVISWNLSSPSCKIFELQTESMKKILVTGNNGYIGSVLTRMLLARGFRVVGLDTNYYEKCDFYSVESNIEQITKDIRDVSTTDLKDSYGIIHLAALSNDPLCDFNEETTYDINYKASVKLAKLAKKLRIKRFVFASSQSIYGKVANDVLVSEDHPAFPLTAYGKSKLLAEQEISKLADNSFTPVFLRPSTVYGISPKLRVDIVLNNLVGWTYTTGQIKLLSDGSPWRPVIHVEDVSNAFIACLIAPRELVHNKVFNVGEKKSFRIKEMAELIEDVISGANITYSNERGSDERSYRVNSDKFRRNLKDYYKQEWKIKKGIKNIYEGYKKHGLTLKEFTGDKYIRLNRLKKLVKEKKLNDQLRWMTK